MCRRTSLPLLASVDSGGEVLIWHCGVCARWDEDASEAVPLPGTALLESPRGPDGSTVECVLRVPGLHVAVEWSPLRAAVLLLAVPATLAHVPGSKMGQRWKANVRCGTPSLDAACGGIPVASIAASIGRAPPTDTSTRPSGSCTTSSSRT